MTSFHLLSVNKTSENFFLCLREWRAFRKRQQRGQIERDSHEFTDAFGAPRLIDETLAFFTPHGARDRHLLLITEGQE